MNTSHIVRPCVLAGLLLAWTPAFGGRTGHPKDQPAQASTLTNDVYRPILINNIFNYYSNNGDGSNNPRNNGAGFEFPKGAAGLTTVFEDGLVWGVRQRDTIKVGGSVYRHGLQAGPIIVSGTAASIPVAADATDPAYRVYRVRRDIPPLPGVSDPNSPEAAGEREILLKKEVPLIGRYETVNEAQLLQQYWDDWNGWPASLGAPYTDVDRNGTYDPAIDIPGPPMADQALWYVANDLSWVRCVNLAGSTPIGLEMQRSVCAYHRAGALDDAIYQSSRVINKSGVVLDSVYLVQWADPDVGNGGDDLVGCDTLLGLGYVYNGEPTDIEYGTTPPAVGFLLLQGPMVAGSATDTALFGFALRPGHCNLPLSTFNFFSQGSGMHQDPEQGNGTTGSRQWHYLMVGLSSGGGYPLIDPTTGDTTRFAFPGDPVAGTGWIDGIQHSPNDRRLCMVTGPFTMAPGDTQEIAVACYAARGGDRLASVSALKREVGAIRGTYRSLVTGMPLPSMTHAITRNGDHPVICFRADARGQDVAGIQVQLKGYEGVVVATDTLSDDGAHLDGTAGDSIYGGTVQMAPLARGLYADAVITYRDGRSMAWSHIADNITTADVSISAHALASDNINSDGVPNPGENVRYTVALRNASSVDLRHCVISASPGDDGRYLHEELLGAHTTQQWSYDPDDPATYLSFTVPSWMSDSTISITLTIADSSEDIWRDTLTFPVRPLKNPVHSTPLQHVVGSASGNFSIAIVDSARVKDHLYIIRGSDGQGYAGRYSVKDSTTGIVLLEDHPLPDPLGHTSPVIDGFKVLIGSIDNRPGMRGWETPSGIRRFTWSGGFAGIGLEGFSSVFDSSTYDRALGTIGMAGNLIFGGIGTTLRPSDYHDVLLKLAPVAGIGLWDPGVPPGHENYSLAYRYLGTADAPPADSSFTPWIVSAGSGFPYQGYDYSVPFSAWDMDTDPPTRLAVGCMENNVSRGLVDGRYWPGSLTSFNAVENSVAREIAFIFNAPYTQVPDPALAVNLSNNSSLPLMWVMTCSRRSEAPWTGGDQFRILARKLVTAADVWAFNPTIVTKVAETGTPASFALQQNYPNPFNPSSDIRYQLSEFSIVRLAVYDILGREVAVLVNEKKAPGAYQVRFDASSLSSGVYFYRLSAGRYVETKKMMLLR